MLSSVIQKIMTINCRWSYQQLHADVINCCNSNLPNMSAVIGPHISIMHGILYIRKHPQSFACSLLKISLLSKWKLSPILSYFCRLYQSHKIIGLLSILKCRCVRDSKQSPWNVSREIIRAEPMSQGSRPPWDFAPGDIAPGGRYP